MSLPPIVKWRYDWQPEPGSAEAQLYSDDFVADADSRRRLLVGVDLPSADYPPFVG